MTLQIVCTDEPKLSTSLLSRAAADKKDELKAQFVPSILTDCIKVELLDELNKILLPNDDKSAGWDIREAERHGALKALRKAINLLP